MYSLIIIMLMSPNYYVDSFELTKVESLAECQTLGEAYLQTPTHPMDDTKEYGFTCTTTPEKYF